MAATLSFTKVIINKKLNFFDNTRTTSCICQTVVNEIVFTHRILVRKTTGFDYLLPHGRT